MTVVLALLRRWRRWRGGEGDEVGNERRRYHIAVVAVTVVVVSLFTLSALLAMRQGPPIVAIAPLLVGVAVLLSCFVEMFVHIQHCADLHQHVIVMPNPSEQLGDASVEVVVVHESFTIDTPPDDEDVNLDDEEEEEEEK